MDWSVAEVEAVVADYFAMLEKELRGERYNKAAHNRAVRRVLSGRSAASVEMKRRNISAILAEVRHPWIEGYKPAFNYQDLLADVVLDRLEDDAALRSVAIEVSDASLAVPQVQAGDLLHMMRTPPNLLEAARIALARRDVRRRARIIDYFEREAKNRAVGDAGEELVVQYERAWLDSLGCGTLADRVEQVSKTRGDGLGYDVLSFKPDGAERFIEVKTTQYGALTPFYVTESERTFSSEEATRYFLYRIYAFAASPAMFSLQGRLDDSCVLSPSQFVAVPR